MKRTAILFTILLCFGCMAFAQESSDTVFNITVGDTMVWRPFSSCHSIGYSVSNRRVINYSIVNFGIQVIALRPGHSDITVQCDDTTMVASFEVKEPYTLAETTKPIKPQTQMFASTYHFNPPTDYFFITFTDPGNHCRETWVKIGDEEAYNDGHGTDRWWSNKTGENWYYRPDAQGWTDDVKWEFEPFGDSFFPLNAFFREIDTDGDLSQYYIGMETVLDVNCWVFFVDFEDGTVIRYWVDPSHGCTLRRQMNQNEPQEAVVYDLKYTRWYFGPRLKKSLHDTRR